MFNLSLPDYIAQNEEKNSGLAHLVGAEFERSCLEILKSEYPDFTFYLYPDLDMDYKILFNLPQYDQGIDIIGIDEENRTALLIQCKYTKHRDKKFSYGIDKLSHLSAQENRFTKSIAVKEMNWRSKIMVMTTGKSVKNCEDDLIVLNGGYLDGKLGFSNFNSGIYEKDVSITKEEEKLILRKYQEEIIEKLTKFYDFQNRVPINSDITNLEKTGKLIMATGTGKTLTFSHYLNNVIEFLDRIPKKIVIVAPTLSLIEQIRIVLHNYLVSDTESKKNIVKICSDGSTDRSLLVFADKKAEKNNENIYLTTYDSFYLFEKMEDLFVILDESHHAVNPNIQKILESLVRSDQLYLTATEKIYDSGYASTDLNSGNQSSSSTDVQKDWKKIMKNMPLIAKYNIGEGIRDKYLSDYNVEIISFVGDKDKNLSKIIIDKILTEESKKIVVYCSRVEKTKSFCKYLGKQIKDLKDGGNETLVDQRITLLTVSGENTLKEKTEIFKKFSEYNIGILLNVSILSEGIDLPCIDTVFFYDNRNSRIELIQNIGRSLRIHPGKKYSTVCVNLDLNGMDLDFDDSDPDSENSDSELEDEETKSTKNLELLRKKCKNVYKTLMYLANEDSTFLDYYRSYGTKRDFIKNNKIKFIGELDQNIIDRVISETYDRFLDRTIENWDKKYEEVKECIELNKKLPKRSSKDSEERSLYRWLGRQRENFRSGKLDNYKAVKLRELKFWNLDSKKRKVPKSFNERLTELTEWVDENGSLPNHSSKDKTEKSLAYWIGGRRKLYKKDKLDSDKIEKLERLKLWSWNQLETEWNQNYQNLIQFVQENGSLPKDRRKDESGKSLAKWIGTRRTNYRKDKLDTDKIQKLEKIPELYLDYDRFDTIYRFIQGYKKCMQYWKENQKFYKFPSKEEGYFYQHIKDIKNLKKYQKYLVKDILCIENKKLPTDLTLISKYLLSLTKKVKLEDYHNAIKNLAQQEIEDMRKDKEIWNKKEVLELVYLDQEEKLLDEDLNERKLEIEERLDIYYILLKNLDKVLELISSYPNLVKIFAYYHAKAYPDIMIEYIRDLFVKNDLRCFVIDLDRVWK